LAGKLTLAALLSAALLLLAPVLTGANDPGYTVISSGPAQEIDTTPTDPAVWDLVCRRVADMGEAARLYDLMAETAKRHGLRLRFVAAVVDAESAFRPAAVSRCGAVGLMQIMPINHGWLGITDATDPAQNLEGGCRYLSRLVAKYRGREDLALLNYNAGPRYARMAREHWPAESRGYIRRVTAGEARMSGRPAKSAENIPRIIPRPVEVESKRLVEVE
jgi:soluble lytic murein transglycosylase-like protein